MNREEEDRIIREATSSEYKEGFVTDVEGISSVVDANRSMTYSSMFPCMS